MGCAASRPAPTCCVCFESCDPVSLACRHIICVTCLNLWARTNETCPMCRAVFMWDFQKWFDKSEAPPLSKKNIQLVTLRCGGAAVDTKVTALTDLDVALESENFDMSIPKCLLVRLGPNLFADLSQTNAWYVSGLVKTCVDPRTRRRLLQGFL